MKKMYFRAAILLLAGSLLCSSCIGSFSLFNKYEEWQTNMTDNKYVNGIVGFILQPIVGTVCLVADALVLNTIEFWSGSNPLEANNVQQVKGEDGRYYAVTTLRNGYKVVSPNGEVTKFTHHKKTDSWTMTQNGVTKEVIRFNTDGTIRATLQDGKTITVTNDQAGLQQVHDAVYATSFYAMQ